MRRILYGAGMALLMSCSSEQTREQADVPEPSGPPIAAVGKPREPAPAPDRQPVWESVASGEGTALRLVATDGTIGMSLACLGRPVRLAVNVPTFEPVMSEDRFALGMGEEPVTLVANPYEQEARPGVTGEGPVPDNFEAFLEAADAVRAVYGAQQIGPYPAPPPSLKALLVEACAAVAG